ncbi:MAG: lipopolysaccharide exporter [Chlamydiales bacterium]
MSDPEQDSDPLDAPRGDVRSGTRWNSLGVGGAQGLRFLCNVGLVSLLDPADFGLMAITLVVTGFLEIFTDFGAGQIVIQRRKLSSRFLASAFSMNMVLAGLVAAGVFLGADVLAALLKAPELPAVLRVVSLLFVLTGAGLVHRALLVRTLAFKRVAIVELTIALVYGLVSLVLASRGLGVWSLVWGTLSSAALGTVMLWILSPWRVRLAWDRSHLREIVGFCAGLLGSSLTSYFLQNTDRVIIARFLGAEALGLYEIALRLVMFPVRLISRVLISVLTPVFARLQDDTEAFRAKFLRAAAGIALLTFPMMVGLACVAEPLVAALWTEEWAPVAPLVMLLAPVGTVRSLASATGPIYVAMGKTGAMFIWGLVFNLATVAAFFMGVPFGVEGVAGAYALVSVALFYPFFAVPFRFIGLPVSHLLRVLLPISAVSMLMAAAVWGLGLALAGSLSIPFELAASILAGAVVYGIGIWVARPPALDDLLSIVASFRGAQESPASPADGA